MIKFCFNISDFILH